MKKNNKEPLDRSDAEIGEDDTVELAVLKLEDAVLSDDEKAEATETALPVRSQAFLWFRQMEAELDRVQARWGEIDAELAERDARIADLVDEVAQLQASVEHGEAEHEQQLRQQGAELAKYRDSLGETERTLEISLEDNEKLNKRIRELDDLAAGLRAELDRTVTSATRARDESAERDRLIESLREDLQGRDTAIAELHDTIRQLEAELVERREAMSLLDKSMQRLTILGASLQRIERRAGEPSAAAGADTRAESNVHYIGSADGMAGARRRMLVSLEGQGSMSFPLSKQSMTIGRGQGSDIRIDGQFVSRIHARVLAHPIGTIIEDLGSKNGILVNSEPVTRRVLHDGDIVSLGGKLDLKYVEIDG